MLRLASTRMGLALHATYQRTPGGRAVLPSCLVRCPLSGAWRVQGLPQLSCASAWTAGTRHYCVSAKADDRDGEKKDAPKELELAVAGDPRLRTPMPPVESQTFIKDRRALRETRERFKQALADFDETQTICANQIGIPHRAFAYELSPAFVEDLGEDICQELLVTPRQFRVLFNPTFTPFNKHKIMTIGEGNISVPLYGAYVDRYEKIRVEAVSELGKRISFEAVGLESSIIQQSVDMLDGILFIDKMDKESLIFSGDVSGDQEAEDRAVQQFADDSMPDDDKVHII